MADDDELYGDLEDSKPAAKKVVPRASAKKSVSIPESSSDRPRSLADEVQYLQKQVASLKEENQSLKRNIGTLYRTAISEIKRKDDEIERLRNLQDGCGEDSE